MFIPKEEKKKKTTTTQIHQAQVKPKGLNPVSILHTLQMKDVGTIPYQCH